MSKFQLDHMKGSISIQEIKLKKQINQKQSKIKQLSSYIDLLKKQLQVWKQTNNSTDINFYKNKLEQQLHTNLKLTQNLIHFNLKIQSLNQKIINIKNRKDPTSNNQKNYQSTLFNLNPQQKQSSKNFKNTLGVQYLHKKPIQKDLKHVKSLNQLFESNYIEPEKITAFKNNQYELPAKKIQLKNEKKSKDGHSQSQQQISEQSITKMIQLNFQILEEHISQFVLIAIDFEKKNEKIQKKYQLLSKAVKADKEQFRKEIDCEKNKVSQWKKMLEDSEQSKKQFITKLKNAATVQLNKISSVEQDHEKLLQLATFMALRIKDLQRQNHQIQVQNLVKKQKQFIRYQQLLKQFKIASKNNSKARLQNTIA